MVPRQVIATRAAGTAVVMVTWPIINCTLEQTATGHILAVWKLSDRSEIIQQPF
jgi:hypothetical protein